MSTRSAGGATTLAAAAYTSSDVFDLESRRIFRRHWLCIGRSSDLDKPSSCRAVEVEGESVLLTRGRDRALRAFYNVCRHRGARLCDAGATAVKEIVRCPYHAWSYSLDGTLVSAPNMLGRKDFEAREHGLIPIGVGEWEGFAFLNFSPTPQPLRMWLKDVLGKFRPWCLERLTAAHRVEYLVEANWKLVFQNYSECYHCPAVHPALNRLTPYRNAGNDLEDGPILGGPMSLVEGSQSMTTDGRFCGWPLLKEDDPQRRTVHYYTFFPNLFLSLHPDYVLTHRLERQSPSRTRVVCQWLFDPKAIQSEGFDPSPAVEFWDMTNRQDWEVCRRCQQGAASRGYRPGPYSDLESIAAAFDRYYRRTLSADEASRSGNKG